MRIRWSKVAVFCAGLVPLALLVRKALMHDLGANPIEVITLSTGRWTLILLLTTLAITPVRKITGWSKLIQFRRMIGLFAFFYVCLHLLTYVWLDQFFDVHSMLHDIAKRRFITAGMTGFALLLPLAITSTSGWIRRLGGARWQSLHRLIYVAAAAGVVHFWWKVKADTRLPQLAAGILLILLATRVALWLHGKRAPVRAAARTVEVET
jgi:methionine sulfoxide reductase heme-binding subunit